MKTAEQGGWERPAWFQLLLVFTLSSVHVCAQPSGTPREDFWAANGYVCALAEREGILYAGGLTAVTVRAAGHAVSLDTSTAAVSTALPEIDGRIDGVTPDGAVGWYIARDFTSVGGIRQPGLARIRSDHSSHASTPPGTMTN